MTREEARKLYYELHQAEIEALKVDSEELRRYQVEKRSLWN